MTVYLQPRYEVWLDTAAGMRLALLDGFSSLSYTKVLNGIGRFSITLPGDMDQTLIGPDRMVEIWRSVGAGPLQLETAGLVRTIAYTEQNGVDVITLGGDDGNGLLESRNVAYASGSDQASKTDYADDMMKAVVRENLGASATDTARDLSAAGLSVAADLSLGPSIEKKFSWKQVLTALRDIADTAAYNGTPVYFQMRPDVISSTQIGWVFETFVNRLGADRTYTGGQPTVFGKAWGNLETPRLVYDYGDEASVVYAGGQGEGADRVIVEVEDTTRSGASPWARRERFADARNEESTAAVTNKAKQTLEAARPRISFSAKLKDTPQTRYGVDWQFGDLVVGSYQGRQFEGAIDGVRVVFINGSGESIEARLEVQQ